ncbi:MAG TPA: hypothetical protein VEI02_04450, partial [Planctomycetota bacterium]|nr:hypothetical protein [Planctomycetota bacterium]
GGTAPKVTSNVAQRTLTSGQTYEVRQLFNWTSDLSDVLAGFSFQEKVNGSNVHVGGRFPGAVDVSTSTVGVTVGVDRFWQSFPKSIKVEGGSVKVGLWPEYGSGPQFGGQYGTPTAPLPGVDAQSLNDYRFEGGRWKTHRMVFDFHASGARTAAQTASFAERVNAPIVGRADPVKVRQSMATGLLFVEDRDYWNFDSFKRYQRFVKIMGDDNEADSIATHGKVGLKKFLDSGCVNGGQQPYGWENYGDIPWADGYCDLHYDWPGSMLLGFLKTGHYGVYDRARDMAAFRRDYGQNHSTDAAEFWRGAQFYEKGWWHGNYSSGLNSHNWVLGLALNYVMFGDEASREAGLENIAYVKRDPPKTWSGMWGSRIPGWAIDNLVHAHNFFGDAAALTEAGLGVARFRDLEVAGGMNGYHLNTGANPPSTDPWMDNIFFIAACRYVIASGDTQYHPFLQRMRTWLKTSCTVIPTTTSLASANLPYVWYMWSPGAPNTASSHLCWPMIDALSHSALLFNDAGDLAVASVLFESMTRYWQRPALSGPVNALNTATYSPITMRATGYPTSESKALGNVLLWGGSHLFVRAYFDGTL